MKSSAFALLSALGFTAAQGVTQSISPPGGSPSGCSSNFAGTFEISVIAPGASSKRDLITKRAACGSGTLVATLKDGKIIDAKGRTGYIASNRQFQFDAPPQAGAIYTAGFGICSNNMLLSFGPTTKLYQCKSGDFYNLYDQSWAPQCSPIQIQVLPCNGVASPGDAQQQPDGQVVGTTIRTTTIVATLSDGQPQVRTSTVAVPLCQIGDGQVQVKTTPCASITTTVAPKPTTTLVPVSQYTDGQIQVTTPAPSPRPTTPVTTPVSSAPTVGPVTSATTAATLSTVRPSNSTSSLSRPSTSAPAPSATAPVNAAGSIEMSSIAALAVGVLGAVWFL